jgi:hypothetical protein
VEAFSRALQRSYQILPTLLNDQETFPKRSSMHGSTGICTVSHHATTPTASCETMNRATAVTAVAAKVPCTVTVTPTLRKRSPSCFSLCHSCDQWISWTSDIGHCPCLARGIRKLAIADGLPNFPPKRKCTCLSSCICTTQHITIMHQNETKMLSNHSTQLGSFRHETTMFWSRLACVDPYPDRRPRMIPVKAARVL